MFKGSKNVEPEQHTSIVSSVGGQANAYTTEDTTVFWQTVPAQYLPLVLWMEADRMATLRIDDRRRSVDEREVVKEERRMRIENQPYGRLNEIIFEQAFTCIPTGIPSSAAWRTSNAATIDDVRDFYRTYYVPSNATMVIAGDFENDTAIDLVNQYLGRVPKAAKPVPRDIPQEPTQPRRSASPSSSLAAAGGRRRAITSPTTATPTPIRCTSCRRCCRTARARASTASWSTKPAWRSPPLAAPTSSRIRTCSTPWRSSTPASRPAAVEKALIAELERIKTEGITERELQRAKNQFARDYILGRESVQDKATQLGHAEVIQDDIATADGEFDIFQKITTADVKRVAQHVLHARESRSSCTSCRRADGDREAAGMCAGGACLAAARASVGAKAGAAMKPCADSRRHRPAGDGRFGSGAAVAAREPAAPAARARR